MGTSPSEKAVEEEEEDAALSALLSVSRTVTIPEVALFSGSVASEEEEALESKTISTCWPLETLISPGFSAENSWMTHVLSQPCNKSDSIKLVPRSR